MNAIYIIDFSMHLKTYLHKGLPVHRLEYENCNCVLNCSNLLFFFVFFNLFIKPSSPIHIFFQMRRCDI